jgi:tripeptide aminopeptidase
MSPLALTEGRKSRPSMPVAELAALAGVRGMLEWFGREKRWILDRHLELCRIPAPTFEEQKRAEWMAGQFRLLGWEARIDRAGNVVANRPGPKPLIEKGPLIALTAHLDTVLAPRNAGEVGLSKDGKLTGPGVSDNGAGLAALLAVARCIGEAPALAGESLPLALVANVGEEGEGNLSGMRYLCRGAALGGRTAAFVVLDGPSTDHITCRALASRRFEVAVTGPGGHSWSDFGAGNPVHALSRAIVNFCDAAAGLPAEPRSSFNFGLIEGGTSINSIPVEARAKLDLRSESPARIDEMAAMLTESLERALEEENGSAPARHAPPRVTAKVREIGSRPGGSIAPGDPLLAHVAAVDKHLGIRAHLDTASTDANIPLSIGIPAISIGAGGHGGGAHTPSEWFHPEGRETGLRRVLLLLSLLMADLDPRIPELLR